MTFNIEHQLGTTGGRLTNLKLRGLPPGMKLWYGQEVGAKEKDVPAAKWNAVRLAFAEPDSFWRMCQIRTEDDEWCTMEPTEFQKEFAQAYQNYRWNYINKPRQAKQSTAAALIILRDTMYGDSMKSTIVAQKREVCDELMDRIIDAYTRLPPELRNPLKKNTKATRERIEFANGNSITTITVGSSGPGVGLSRSRYLITEGCEMDSQTIKDLTTKLFPGINKRPNARLIWETTPGSYASQMYDLWRKAWQPKASEYSRFNAVFLKWWKDPSYVMRDYDTGELMELGPLTDEEQKFMDEHPGCTRHHIYFRRVEISSTFDGKIDEFNNKYPPGPLEGWATAKKQIYGGDSMDYLKEMRKEAEGTEEKESETHGLWEFVPPDPQSYYLFCVDPSNFVSHGDYSGVSVFDVNTGEEVAAWEGFAVPTEMHARVRKAAKYYRQAGSDDGNCIMIENNISAMVALVEAEGILNQYYSNHKSGKSEPGWRASKSSLDEAEGCMDIKLKEKSIKLNSPTGIQQVIMFDGAARNTRVKKGRNTSHSELARTYIMAAYAMEERVWPRRLTDERYKDMLASEAARAAAVESEEFKERMRQLNMNLRKRRRQQDSEINVWAPGAGISR